MRHWRPAVPPEPWRKCAYCGASPIDYSHACKGMKLAELDAIARTDGAETIARLQWEHERADFRAQRDADQAKAKVAAEVVRRAESMDRLNRALAMLDNRGR